VTRPDSPQGRGRQLAPTPVRALALGLQLPCDAPESANAPEYLSTLAALEPDLFIVADYGEILRKGLRDLPRIGAFNLHASILPRYRGAAPVVHALLCGEKVTGVSLFRLERSVDSGPIVDLKEVEVDPLETAGELEERLSRVAADLLLRNLDAFLSGTFRETRQDENLATFAPKIEKSQGSISWDSEPEKLKDFVRALNPWPGAFSFLHSGAREPERTIFLRVRPRLEGSPSPAAAGTIEEVRKETFCVRCRGGAVEVLQIQRAGKLAMDAASYLRGRQLGPGDFFGPAEVR